MFLYLVRAEITTDSAWGTDQPGKACVKVVGYKPRGAPLQIDCKDLGWGTALFQLYLSVNVKTSKVGRE